MDGIKRTLKSWALRSALSRSREQMRSGIELIPESAEELVEHMRQLGFLRTKHIQEAFRKIDRKDFIPGDSTDDPYRDAPLSIGHGQTISQPSTVAFMFELLEPNAGQRILDVGSGSGWTTALLAQIVGEDGRVIGRERIPELVAFAKNNLKKFDFPHASVENIDLPIEGQYDRILVSAAGENIPETLLQALKRDGIMVIPIRNAVVKVAKSKHGRLRTTTYKGFGFVPFIT